MQDSATKQYIGGPQGGDPGVWLVDNNITLIGSDHDHDPKSGELNYRFGNPQDAVTLAEALVVAFGVATETTPST